jgi:hypothetical protein
LERDLLSGGEQVVRVPPKLMAQTRYYQKRPLGDSPTEAFRCLKRLPRIIFHILNLDPAVSFPAAA